MGSFTVLFDVPERPTLVNGKCGLCIYSYYIEEKWRIHRKTREFCLFDEYNWDVTMWVAVCPSFGCPVYTLDGPRTSSVHFGKCGLHQGQVETAACVNDGTMKIDIEAIDKTVNIKSDWRVNVYTDQSGYTAGFKGWGGWGDERDH